MLDTLTCYYVLPAADSAASWGRQAVVPSEIYGPISSLSGQVTTQTIALADGIDLDISWQGGVAVMLLLVMFCYIAYRFGSVVRASFKALFSINDTICLFENSTVEFGHYIGYGRWLFLLSVAVMADGMLLGGIGDSLLNIGAVMLVFFVAGLMSDLLTRLLSVFDYNVVRWVELRSIKKIYRTVGALIFALPSIAFSYSLSMHILLWVLVGGVLVFYFCSLLVFFRQRGFSFLQWILYLCAVEIAPFALLWGVASRLNGIHF